MERVPLEILHLVCSYLSPSKARSLRVCCKTLANVGACFGFREISFYLWRPDFARLRAIAEHPIISKHVYRLIYHAANLEEPATSLADYLQRTGSIVYRHRAEKCQQNWLPQSAFLNEDPPDYSHYNREPISIDDIQENYSQYVDAVKDQRNILSRGEDLEVLKHVFSSLTQLRTVMVSNGCYFDGQAIKSPFDPFFVYSLHSLEPQGVHQMNALLRGLKDSGALLTSLYAGVLDSDLIEPTFFDRVLAISGRLEFLDLVFDTIDPEATFAVTDTRNIVKARNHTDTGIIAATLKALPGLLGISIGFSMCSQVAYPASLENVLFPGFKWHQLRHLSLAAVETERQDLMDFFSLHKGTLRCVLLRECRLVHTSWARLLRDMKSILKLEKICVSGNTIGRVEAEEDYPGFRFSDSDNDKTEVWWLGDPEMEFERRLADSVTAWFLHGKSYPLTQPQMRSGDSDLDSV